MEVADDDGPARQVESQVGGDQKGGQDGLVDGSNDQAQKDQEAVERGEGDPGRDSFRADWRGPDGGEEDQAEGDREDGDQDSKNGQGLEERVVLWSSDDATEDQRGDDQAGDSRREGDAAGSLDSRGDGDAALDAHLDAEQFPPGQDYFDRERSTIEGGRALSRNVCTLYCVDIWRSNNIEPELVSPSQNCGFHEIRSKLELNFAKILIGSSSQSFSVNIPKGLRALNTTSGLFLKSYDMDGL